MPFKSTQPDIELPRDISIWDWLFDSSASVLRKHESSELRGYCNGLTGERIDYAQVREASTYLSTALVKKYGLKEGHPIALFSPNNIWYPVAMVSTYTMWLCKFLMKLDKPIVGNVTSRYTTNTSPSSPTCTADERLKRQEES